MSKYCAHSGGASANWGLSCSASKKKIIMIRLLGRREV